VGHRARRVHSDRRCLGRSTFTEAAHDPSDLIRFALEAFTAVLIFTGDPPIWLLAVLNGLFGAAQAFFEPACNGIMPRTVPADLIQEAHAFRHTSYSVASFAGPAIATTLAITIGFGWVYAIDAGTFALSAASLVFVRSDERPSAEVPRRPSIRSDLVAGFHEVRSRAQVWVIPLVALVVLFTALAPFYALGATVGEEQYGSTAVFGRFQTAAGVGALSGALAALTWRPERPLATGSMFMALRPLGVGACAHGAPVAVVIVGGLAQGFTFAVFVVWWDTALAERIPPGVALPGELVRLHGLVGPDAGRVPPGGRARRPLRPLRGPAGGMRPLPGCSAARACIARGQAIAPHRPRAT
jgi:MFS family permease